LVEAQALKKYLLGFSGDVWAYPDEERVILMEEERQDVLADESLANQ